MSGSEGTAIQPVRRLLNALADGDFQSGEALAGELGVSRAYLWKLVEQLRETGLHVDAVRGRGYRLPAPVEWLDRDAILEAVGRPLDLSVEDEVTSTNQLLLVEARQATTRPRAMLAERQTAGRGRWGRRWETPFGSGLAISLLWPFSGRSSLAGLSVAVGIALAEGLAELGVKIGVKWPNDLQVDGAKLGGILIEVVGEAAGPQRAVIGWGLNVNLPAAVRAAIEQDVTDLYTVLGAPGLARNRTAGVLIARVMAACELFEVEGLTPFLERWPRWDVLFGERVTLRLPDGDVEGVAMGVDASGALIVEDAGGQRSYFTGEIEMRVRR